MALNAIPFGLSLGMLGGGGSVLAVPVLVYVLGQSVHEATTASLVVVTAGALAGGLGHARGGRVCWRHAGAFTAAALPGVVVGTALGNPVDGGALIAAFAVVMLAAAAAMWRKAGSSARAPSAGSQASCPPLRLGRDLTAGLLIGAMTGFFGGGGGFLVVPTLAIALALGALAGAAVAGRVPQRRLGRGFAALVTAVAAYLLISAAFPGGPPGST